MKIEDNSYGGMAKMTLYKCACVEELNNESEHIFSRKQKNNPAT